MRHDGERLKVVYIEDNPANLDLVARVLESTGRYRVIGALDVGCASFIEKPFDIHEFRREVARVLVASGHAL